MTTSAVENKTWVPELTFAARLALVRHQMGWNIKEAALACDLPAQSWRGWELQRRMPHDIIDVARKVAARTSVDRDWLLFGPNQRSVRVAERLTPNAIPAPASADHPTRCAPDVRSSAGRGIHRRPKARQSATQPIAA